MRRSLTVALVVSFLAPACGGGPHRHQLAGGYPHASPGYAIADGEGYNAIIDNGEVRVAEAPSSTFAIDVDTASMANVRRFLEDGQLPPADAVRIEEMINYFDYDYDPRPTGEHPFSVTTEVAASCPRGTTHTAWCGGVCKGRRAGAAEEPSAAARNLVFLIDVVGLDGSRATSCRCSSRPGDAGRAR